MSIVKTLGSTGLCCLMTGCGGDVVDRTVETPNHPAEATQATPPEPDPDATRVDSLPVEGTQDPRSAVAFIAEARCSREAGCNNIGDGKKFSSSDDCMARIRNDWREDLNARECPGGANQSELNECVMAIRNEDCGSPFDTLARVSECASGQICID